MKDLNKYGRNNRTCISSLDVNHLFDYTDTEYFYLCNDMLNLSHIREGDLIRFNMADTDNEIYKIFGFVIMACNMGKTTFLVCRHFDDNGKEYIQDYAYSSFKHAFEKLNDPHAPFVAWENLTNIKDVKTPNEMFGLWEEHNNIIYNSSSNQINEPNSSNQSLETQIKMIKYDIEKLTERVNKIESIKELQSSLLGNNKL